MNVQLYIACCHYGEPMPSWLERFTHFVKYTACLILVTASRLFNITRERIRNGLWLEITWHLPHVLHNRLWLFICSIYEYKFCYSWDYVIPLSLFKAMLSYIVYFHILYTLLKSMLSKRNLKLLLWEVFTGEPRRNQVASTKPLGYVVSFSNFKQCACDPCFCSEWEWPQRSLFLPSSTPCCVVIRFTHTH